MRYAAVLLFFLAFGCSSVDRPVGNSVPTLDERAERLKLQKAAIERFFRPMKVESGDWLATQREAGETFEEFLASSPTLPNVQRRTIYIQPIGTFNSEQRRAIRLTAEYMRVFYSLPVKLNADRALGKVPDDKKRLIEYRNNLQIRTQYFLDDVLPKLLPDDAAALLAFTNYDLYPSDTWAFVFGQATFAERVGVWSLYQFTPPGRKTTFDQLLDRTLKVSMHEAGHMFSMKHCIKYECLMAGTNHLAETDRRPLDNCPECMAKLAWAMNYDPETRYDALAEFWMRQGRPREAEEMRQKMKAVGTAGN
ncbi:MAG TPA: archaemetzincin [Pyrinomonadaceae bacterium]|nr:archaemetzincin [Pyrinomonadaceae bacterium]